MTSYCLSIPKYRLVLFIVIMLPNLVGLSQNIWVVNNSPGSIADFDNVQDAIDTASSGDRIYIAGSVTPYTESPTLNKTLHIIGPAFWKIQNGIPDENTNWAYVNGALHLSPGSDSSIIEGLTLAEAKIESNNIVFRYNYLHLTNSNSSTNAIVQLINYPSNAFIYGNYLTRCIRGSGDHIYFYNNYCAATPDNSYQYWDESNTNSQCQFQNCAIGANNGTVSNCSFRNNIVQSSEINFNNCVVEYNIFVDDDPTLNNMMVDSLGPGNIDGVDISTVWDLSNPSPDAKFQLVGDSTTNPAFGAGIDGEDCGIYGGPSPYRLSGIVSIPTVYQMLVPIVGDTTNMLNVKIKAKSN